MTDLADMADAAALAAAREAYENAPKGRKIIAWARLYQRTHDVLEREVRAAAAAAPRAAR